MIGTGSQRSQPGEAISVFWLSWAGAAETTTTTASDKLTITANGTRLATFSNLNHITDYLQHT